MVTLEDLSEYKILKREIEDLRRRITKYEKVADVVTGSSPEPPYTPRSIKITGCDYCGSKRLYKKYLRKIKQLVNKAEEIEDYISTIEDSLIRQIIRLRFLDGLNWRDVAQRIGGGNTEGSIMMAFKRFYQKEHC